MSSLAIAEVLGRLDAPVHPAPRFADQLLAALDVELRFVDAAVTPSPEVVDRRVTDISRAPSWRRRWRPNPRRLAAVAAAVVVLAAVVVTLPLGTQSALAVVEEARARYADIPSFSATVVQRQFGALIAEERGLDADALPDFVSRWQLQYADDRHFRATVADTSYDDSHTDAAPSQMLGGSFEVADGDVLAQYLAADDHLVVRPIEEAQGERYVSTGLLDPQLHSFSQYSDEVFAQRCEVLPDETVAGRVARRLSCRDLDQQGASSDLWFDAETGFVLRMDLAGSQTGSGFIGVEGTVIEVTAIEYRPAFPADAFEFDVPEGATVQWTGPPPAPERFRVTPDEQARADTVTVGQKGGPLLSADGALFSTGVDGGKGEVLKGGRGFVTRIDPSTAEVVWRTDLVPRHQEQPRDTTGPLVSATRLALVGDEVWVGEYHAGMSTWDADTEQWRYRSRIARLDADDGTLLEPITLRGEVSGIALAGDAVWVAVSQVRSVTSGPAQYEYGRLLRLDPATGEIVDSTDLDGNPSALVASGDRLALAMWQFDEADVYGPGRWVLRRFDPASQKGTTTELPIGWINDLVARGGVTWASAALNDGGGVVLRIGGGGDITSRKGIREIGGLALLDGQLWVADMRRDALVRFDATTLRRLGDDTVTGPRPFRLAAGDGELWVSHEGDGSVVRVATP